MNARHVILILTLTSVFTSGFVILSVLFTLDGDNDGNEQPRISHEEKDWNTLLDDLNQPYMSPNKSSHDQHFLDIINRHFRWLSGSSPLENYFLHGHFVKGMKYRSRYTHNAVTLLPFFHDVEGDFSSCLKRTGFALNLALSPEMTFTTRYQWDTSNEGAFKFKNKYKLHLGWAAFGAGCGKDVTNNGEKRINCGHAMIMQDPIQHAIHEYGRCVVDPNVSPLCSPFHEGHMSIEDWIIYRGSVVFKSLIFNSGVCTGRGHVRQHLHKSEGIPPKRHELYQNGGDSCALRHHAHIDSLEPKEIRILLDFITENLSRLFSYVGIYEDFINSLSLLNHVFRLPLHECEFLTKFDNPKNPLEGTSDAEKSHQGILARKARYVKKLDQIRYSKSVPVLLSMKIEKEPLQDHLPELSSLVKTSSDDLSFLRSISEIENNVMKMADSFQEEKDQIDASRGKISFSDLESTANNNRNSRDDKSINIPNVSGADILSNTFFNERNGEEEDSFDLNGEFIEAEGNDVIHNDISDKEILSNHVLTFYSRQLVQNDARTTLYERLSQNEKILKALSYDLELFKAVKRLYSRQKQLFFNTVHHS